MKQIAIIGSTGSIGTQTLDIIRQHPDRFKATVLTAGSNIELLIAQAKEFRPHLAVIADPRHFTRLYSELTPLGIETAAGADAIADAMERHDFEMVVTATVGYSGLLPTLRAIKAGKIIALANKETLVVAGELINRSLASSASVIIPVDSEHSAIYQCLAGEGPRAVSRLIITASGGPFRNMSIAELDKVTPADALRHPNWQMGAKITIDSATMLNKAFEIIEARWLFHIPGEKIEAVVHPQSIVHSMIELRDGAVKAQLGLPDMHLPISYALGEGSRMACDQRLSLSHFHNLEFYEPDPLKFPCITLGHYALEQGGITACVINAANEIANKAFRDSVIGFKQIYEVITDTLTKINQIESPTLDDYIAVNALARSLATEKVARLSSKSFIPDQPISLQQS